MATFTKSPLDFEPYKETWAKYELADGAVVKVRAILTKVVRVEADRQSVSQTQGGQQPTHKVDFQFITVVLTNERGPPDSTVHSKEAIEAAIVKEDVRFRTVEQDWNEYVADDNTKIKIQPMLVRVAKTSLFDPKGEPVYNTEVNATVNIAPSKAKLPSREAPGRT